jgi:hypothetical protein
VRLNVEALEDRLVPSGTYTWLGGDPAGPTDGTIKANWSRVGGTDQYPGANPNDLTDVVRAARRCALWAAPSV